MKKVITLHTTLYHLILQHTITKLSMCVMEIELNTLKGNVTINYTNKTPYIKIKRTRLCMETNMICMFRGGTVLYMNGVGTR